MSPKKSDTKFLKQIYDNHENKDVLRSNGTDNFKREVIATTALFCMPVYNQKSHPGYPFESRFYDWNSWTGKKFSRRNRDGITWWNSWFLLHSSILRSIYHHARARSSLSWSSRVSVVHIECHPLMAALLVERKDPAVVSVVSHIARSPCNATLRLFFIVSCS